MKTHLKHSALFLLAAGILLSPPSSFGASLTWDPTHVVTNPPTGSGTWSSGTANWSDGVSNVAWDASPTYTGTAVFGASSGADATATVSGTIGLGRVMVNTTGANTLNISGGLLQFNTSSGAYFSVNNSQYNVVVTSTIASTNGLTKDGSGGLRLGYANTYTGTTAINAGTLYNNVDNGVSSNSHLNIGSSGQLQLNGKNQAVQSLSGTGSINNRVTSGVTLSIIGSSTTTYTGAIASTGSNMNLLVNGAGTKLTLTNASNNYSGKTTITAGSLILNSSIVNSSTVTVNGGMLSSGTTSTIQLGAGTVAMSSGTIAAGGLGVSGTFSLASGQNFTTTGGTLLFDLNSASSFDTIVGVGSGAFSLTNTTLMLSGLTGTAGTYQIFSGFGGSNVISGLTISGLDAGYSGSLDTSGLLTVVPEPGTLALMVFGSVGLIAARRRRAIR